MTDQDKIYVIGDSHVNFFSGQEFINFVPFEFDIRYCRDILVYFKTFNLGPVLAYNLNKDKSQNKVKEKIDFLLTENIIPHGAYILCCFGEIDLRTQVFKQTKLQNASYQKVVDDILREYASFLQKMTTLGYKMICWGPVASQKDKYKGNKDFPTVGTEDERNLATKYFNQQLEKICADLGVYFVSIYEFLIDKNGKTKAKYFADKCHLSQKAMTLAKNKFSFFTPDISIRRPNSFYNFFFHKYKSFFIKFICLFVPLHSWRKRIREYCKNV